MAFELQRFVMVCHLLGMVRSESMYLQKIILIFPFTVASMQCKVFKCLEYDHNREKKEVY
jgi:hypothetical protein